MELGWGYPVVLYETDQRTAHHLNGNLRIVRGQIDVCQAQVYSVIKLSNREFTEFNLPLEFPILV